MKKFRGKLLPEKSYKGVDEGPEYKQGPYASQSECHATFTAMVTLPGGKGLSPVRDSR